MQVDDRPEVSELTGSALSAGDLSPSNGPCGLDKVMAIGLLGMRDKMADVVFRLKYANNATAYHDGHQAITELAKRLDRAENWRMQQKLQDMAKAVLDYWLDDICEVCGARKNDTEHMGGTARKVTGMPKLEREYCKMCNGSGKRQFPWADQAKRIALAHTALLVAVEETERRLTASLITKLFAAGKDKT